jgi:hypothetical protein
MWAGVAVAPSVGAVHNSRMKVSAMHYGEELCREYMGANRSSVFVLYLRASLL